MVNIHKDYFRQAAFRFALCCSHKIPDGQSLLWQYYNQRKMDEVLETPDYDFCWACVGLLTYGKIEVLNDLINHLPPVNIDYGGARVDLLSQSVVNMLPLPDNLNDPLGRRIQYYKQEFREWFQENEANLIWNDEEGRFILKDENSSTE